MPKRNRRTPRSNTNTHQVLEVQGPQKMPIGGQHREPEVGMVTVNSDLTEKYLGSAPIGLQAALQVLSTRNGNELLREHGYELFRRMMLDPEVNADVNTIVQGACAQPINITSPLRPTDENYTRSQKLADFLNWVLAQFDVDMWRREQLRSALTMGNAVSEMDWGYVETGKYRNKLVIENMRLLIPEYYGFIVDQWGYIYGVAPTNQIASFPLANIIQVSATGITPLAGAVPTYKLSIWTWDKKGTDPRGTSILSAAHVPWWGKQRTLEEWSCWIGRYAQPSLVATPGPDAVTICVKDSRGNDVFIEPTKALLEALQKFGNASILALPHGSEVDVLQATGGVDPFIKSIAMFNVEISRALLGQHLATNEGAHQSRASADVQAVVLRQLINSCRYFMARQFQRDIIRPIIEANFGDVGDLMPVVDLGDGDGYPPTISDVASLLQSGYFTQDQLVKLDRILGFPVRQTEDPAGPQAISNKGKEQEAIRAAKAQEDMQKHLAQTNDKDAEEADGKTDDAPTNKFSLKSRKPRSG